MNKKIDKAIRDRGYVRMIEHDYQEYISDDGELRCTWAPAYVKDLVRFHVRTQITEGRSTYYVISTHNSDNEYIVEEPDLTKALDLADAWNRSLNKDEEVLGDVLIKDLRFAKAGFNHYSKGRLTVTVNGNRFIVRTNDDKNLKWWEDTFYIGIGCEALRAFADE